jgi:Tfp pilus assembly protein PilN
MALPPSAPTSFVPHLGSASTPRFGNASSGVLAALSYACLASIFILAIGTFLYGRFLASSQAGREAELATAQATIDYATVETFVRLRNRLVTGRSLLASHTSFATFFASFEKTLPVHVRFTSLRLSTQEGGAHLEGTGLARSFNALAAASEAFAEGSSIKDAVFSNIKINKDNSVSFSLSARLDAKSLTFGTGEAAPLP